MLWSPKEVSVEEIQDDWILVERMAMRGDIVVHSDNKKGQMGTIVDVHTFATVEATYGENSTCYEAVPTKLLFPASEWRFELLVWRNGWIGSVHKLYWRLKIQLQDSETILTIDTRTSKHVPVSVARDPSRFLKDVPGEGTLLVGSTVAVHTNSVVEATEGDVEWIEAVGRRAEHPDYMNPISSDSRGDYAIGKIMESEISSLYVIWTDHAKGGGVGDTRPTSQQRLSDVKIIDPYYYNCFARYELTWLTPDIINHYATQDHFIFSDGTSIPVSAVKSHYQRKLTSDGSSFNASSFSTNESVPTSKTSDSEPQATPNYSKAPENDFHNGTTSLQVEENAVASKTKELETQEIQETVAAFSKNTIGHGSRYARHPEPEKVNTMSGAYERELDEADIGRRTSLNAQFVVEGQSGYRKENLAYIKSLTRFVDVQWQDGSISKKVLSTDLVPYLHLGDTDFQPLDYVQSVPTTVEETTETRRGVVQTVDHTNRVVTVWWVKTDQIEPHVSIYMLDDADSRFHYRVGYFVLRSLHDQESLFDGTAGLVDNMDERGRIYVLWAEGTSGWYYPNQLIAFDIADYDLEVDDEGIHADQLAGDLPRDDDIRYIRTRFARPDHEDEYEWESESMVGADELPRSFLYMDGQDDEIDENEAGDDGSYDTGSDSDVDSGSDSKSNDDDDDYVQGISFSEDLRRALAASLKSAQKGANELEPVALEEMLLDRNLPTVQIEPTHPEPTSESTSESKVSEPQPAGSSSENSDVSETEPSTDLLPFRTLQELPQNHAYAKNKAATNQGRQAMKEWKLLQEATLQGAYVIGYEDRMDCFRFIIVGAPETPFYLSWFMFDLQLDSDHPNHPPRVFFRSLGPKLHPNLYEDGNVCLSLLGTWQGVDVENWDPANSNILQVVLSIQGLILGVKEPYYLEAGYDRHRGTTEGAANSLVYNERSFLLSVQQMKKLIENPPIEFKTLVHQSFKKHKTLLLALEGALSTDSEILANVDMTQFGLPKGPPSIGFRSAFKSIFPSVKKAIESL